MTATAEIMRYRHLLLCLTWRDVRVRYKQSILGIAWAVLLPVSMMLVFTFVFTRAIDARSFLPVDMPYPLYAYLGLVPWTFFSVSLTNCVNCLAANRNLLTKVYFPREVFPLSCVAAAFVDFCIAMLVLMALMAYFILRGQWTFSLHASMLFLPVVIMVQVTLTLGLGMLLATANLFYRDVRQIFGVVIQLWMFVSAVVVPVPRDGSTLAAAISANPMAWIIEAYRDCVVYGRLPAGGPFAYATTVAILILLAGWWWFHRASFRFAECV